MKNTTLTFAALILTAFTLVFLALQKDPSPHSVTRPTLESILNVHGSPKRGLRICGRTFFRVKGGPPYYVAVPTTPFVLLAYESHSGDRTLVVCDTNECSFREIPLGDVVFGGQIGFWSATNGQMGDTVESVSSNRIVLVSKGFRYVERSLLDLNNDTIRVVDVDNQRHQIHLKSWMHEQLPAQGPN